MSTVPVRFSGGRASRQEPRKVNKTCILITINTNQRYGEGDRSRENDEKALEQVTTRFLRNLKSYVKVLEPNAAWDTNHVFKVNCQYAVEVGQKKGRLHTHVLVQIDHNTRIHLDYRKVKEHYQNQLGLPTVYFNAKLVRPRGESWLENYVQKYL
jgi:hypothetical protein